MLTAWRTLKSGHGLAIRYFRQQGLHIHLPLSTPSSCIARRFEMSAMRFYCTFGWKGRQTARKEKIH